MLIDRGANTDVRQRRALQHAADAPPLDGISIVKNSAGVMAINPQASGGLSISGTGVTILLSDTSLQLAVGGLSARLANNSGLQVSTGLLLKLADGSLQLAAGGVSVKLVDTSLVTAAGGVGVNLATNSGLQISAGLLLKLADTSFVLTAGGVGANLATSGGLQISTGLLVRGARIVTADPTASNGDQWYNSTSNLFKAQAIGLIGQRQLTLLTDGKGTLISNSTAFTPTQATVTLPAGFWAVGRTVRVKAWGTYSTAVASNLVLGAFIDAANLLGDGPQFAAPVPITGARWFCEVAFTCVALGTVSTVRTSGFIYYETGATNLAVLGNNLNVNTANAMVCEAVAQFSVANAGNQVQGYGCIITVDG